MDYTSDDEEDATTINTDENTIDDDDGDEIDEDWKMTGEQFAVGYLLNDSAFAEWYFGRNRWDTVEQQYDIERKRRAQPEPAPAIRIDLAAQREESHQCVKRNKKKPTLIDNIIAVLGDRQMTSREINEELGREYTQNSIKGVQMTMMKYTDRLRIVGRDPDNKSRILWRVK